MSGKKIVALTGNIGAGKSLIAERFASFYHFDFYGEKVNKTVLDNFYKCMDQAGVGYVTQLYFITSRFGQRLEMQLNPNSCVQDRIMDEDVYTFSKNLYNTNRLTKDEFEKIKSMKDSLTANLQPIDLVVYLKADVETLKQRILKRIRLNPKRENERGLTLPENDYLAQLNELYDDWFKNYGGRKLKIETDNLKLANDLGKAPMDFGNLEETIKYIHKYV
ncbi:MAG: deoxynucleoside kinase [Nanoarchaeota archaeon]|nr:deoxynucleoside kinase [Nanoarchaeota archaeon]MBU1031291.1 deoxynucleoside kinase [Nanoarchaeota archaeon]MBU1849521.1 deoxynucleoside kinase [Nanoarchaeota archaeon]